MKYLMAFMAMLIIVCSDRSAYSMRSSFFRIRGLYRFLLAFKALEGSIAFPHHIHHLTLFNIMWAYHMQENFSHYPQLCRIALTTRHALGLIFSKFRLSEFWAERYSPDCSMNYPTLSICYIHSFWVCC